MFARLTAAAFLAAALAAPVAAEPNWAAVAQALGKDGSVMPGGIYRVGLPRSDLKVRLDGVDIKPALALGSWLAFKAMSDSEAMVMGDLVLTHEEVNPVMKVLLDDGLEITALHNHLLRSEPATMYMHVSGHGDPVKLATALREALGKSHTPFTSATAASSQAPTPAAAADQEPELDTATLDAALGRKGKMNGGVYQVSIPRAESITEREMDVPEAMGSAVAINFQPTGNGKAATTGDFVLVASEVNPVLRALRGNGIEVTAIHNHMLDDQPRLYFMHFWANADVAQLARGLKAALAAINVARS
jgi:uncharacterized membrane protein